MTKKSIQIKELPLATTKRLRVLPVRHECYPQRHRGFIHSGCDYCEMQNVNDMSCELCENKSCIIRLTTSISRRDHHRQGSF